MRRISSLPRFLECPSSEEEKPYVYDPPSEAADSGSAAHVALMKMVRGEEVDLASIAHRYQVEPDEVDALYRFGQRAWKKLVPHFPNARAEERLEGEVARGTADIFHNDGVTMVVGDWKSNRVKRGYMNQLIGYAAAAVDTYGMPESGQVTVIVIWLRFHEYEVLNLTEADIESFKKKVWFAEKRIGKAFAPGSACEFCPHQLDCTPRRHYLQGSAGAIQVADEEGLSPAVLGKLYSRAKMLSKALDRYDKALRMALANGPLEDDAGNQLTLVEQTRDKVDPRAAWPILESAGFDEDDLAGCISMSKTAVLKVVSDRAARGKKGHEKAAMMDALRGAGAVTQTTSKTIKVTNGGTP